MRLVLLVGALAAGCVWAEELSIRLTGQAQPDSWSVSSIVEGVTRPWMSDREKALAIHSFGMAHLIHFNGPMEEREEYITDPVKLIGVYGYALCGNNSAAMTALYNAAGLKTRIRSMPAHSVPEVWFENKWNYIDTDMFGFVRLPNGGLASVDELAKEPELFLKQTDPPNPYYPYDRKEDMASVFQGVKASHNYHPYPNAHLMNLALRTGESATMYYRPQGKFLLTTIKPADLGIVYKDYWTLGPVRRGSLAWTDQPPAAYGNGLIEYKPDLRAEAFRLENQEMSGVGQGQGKQQPVLTASAPNQPATMVLEMSSPWVVVGRQNDLTDFDDDSDGAVISGLFWRMDKTDENRILVSADAGRTWKKVWESRSLGAVPFQVDVTRYAKGRYRYWVKFEWVDRKGTGRVGVEGLELKTWVALSPMALPRLVAGKNSFTLTTAPRRTWYHESRWDRNEPLQEQKLEGLQVHSSAPYLRPVNDGPGTLEFALGPAGTVDEVRFSALVRRLRNASKLVVTLALSEDGVKWRELERFSPNPEHDTNQMWFNHVMRDEALKGASTRLRVTIEGGGLEKVIANSVVESLSKAASSVRVTHAWQEEGRPRTATALLSPRSTRRYEVETGVKVVNEWLRFEAVPRAQERQ